MFLQNECFEIGPDIDFILQIDRELRFHKKIYEEYQFKNPDMRLTIVDTLKHLTKERKELLEKCGVS